MSTSTDSEVQSENGSLISYAAKSDIGMRREENQDSLGIISNSILRAFIVADGMGGVQGGKVASQLAIESFERFMLQQTEVTPEILRAAVDHANSKIFERGIKEPELAGMGTTFVGFVFVGAGMFLINVGDSRAYRLRLGKISQLSQDHTLVMELLRSGTINPEQVHNHPVSHMLTRSLGPTEAVDVDCQLLSDGPLRGDVYLLCSDGLYNLVKDEEIQDILAEGTIQEAVESLVALANKRGGSDNITVLAIQVGPEFPEISLESRRELLTKLSYSNGEHGLDQESDAIVGYVASENADPDLSDLWSDTMEAQLDAQGADGEASSGESAAYSKNGDREDQEIDSSADDQEFEVRENISLESLLNSQEPQTGKKADASPPKSEFAARKQSHLGDKKQKGPPASKVIDSGSRIFSKVLFVGPFIFGAALGGIAVAALLYTPMRMDHELARLIPKEQLPPPSENSGAMPQPDPNGELQEKSEISPSSLGDLVHHVDETHHLSKFIDERGIARRRDMLQSLISKLDYRIAAFDNEIGSKRLEEIQAVATREAETLQKKLEEIRDSIDVATRKLAIWYSRRKRLESVQAIDLASEVAVTSDEVKEKKQLFESASYDYLKQSEHLRYNPEDAAQAQKVASLLRLRKQRIEDLSLAVANAINMTIADSDQRISELTLERDRIQAKLKDLEDDIALVKIVSGNDPIARLSKKAELIRQRELAKAELLDLHE